ncbi:MULTISPECIES: hypothetical protein [Burkholderia]|uniref:hypothetical protein n=1 Tax=Burkholderia TaxID=32008 RepID=UPI000550DCA0|nr:MULTISPECIES: hypothetical protein [Burkholderia]AOJ13153.1 hypothetical protein WJ02_05910 [Burkholderia vietnamiensis]TCT31951.1 hypothetical protein EC918_102179 [Burkholderia vietnamiensis]SCZ28164.1 hypothetical protein SAMN02787148_106257 [Burkholderia vietnamiensis]SFX63135.1 hypothetical protein SAMN02787160_106258 [Burkholderia vietnamiensis]HDR9256410.1 hypothetical protein [Burkholderia vietnamiensis]
MKVKAAPGVRVPMDGAPRKYIEDDKAIDVDETPYYLLRVKDGDLIRTDLQVDDGKPATQAPRQANVLPAPAAGVVSE